MQPFILWQKIEPPYIYGILSNFKKVQIGYLDSYGNKVYYASYYDYEDIADDYEPEQKPKSGEQFTGAEWNRKQQRKYYKNLRENLNNSNDPEYTRPPHLADDIQFTSLQHNSPNTSKWVASKISQFQNTVRENIQRIREGVNQQTKSKEISKGVIDKLSFHQEEELQEARNSYNIIDQYDKMPFDWLGYTPSVNKMSFNGGLSNPEDIEKTHIVTYIHWYYFKPDPSLSPEQNALGLLLAKENCINEIVDDIYSRLIMSDIDKGKVKDSDEFYSIEWGNPNLSPTEKEMMIKDIIRLYLYTKIDKEKQEITATFEITSQEKEKYYEIKRLINKTSSTINSINNWDLKDGISKYYKNSRTFSKFYKVVPSSLSIVNDLIEGNSAGVATEILSVVTENVLLKGGNISKYLPILGKFIFNKTFGLMLDFITINSAPSNPIPKEKERNIEILSIKTLIALIFLFDYNNEIPENYFTPQYSPTDGNQQFKPQKQ